MLQKSDEEFVDRFYDTSDFVLLRRGIWLRQRHGLWQTRRVSTWNITVDIIFLSEPDTHF
jgi:hypothetical protein